MRYHGFARRDQDVNQVSSPVRRTGGSSSNSPSLIFLALRTALAHCRAGPQERQGDTMPHPHPQPVTVGKYLVSPIIRMLDNGWYACSVSIRSGRGEQSTDRVLRLTRLFRDALAAAEYAVAEGLQWIGGTRSNAVRPA
jgi:hypothetical protein